MNVAWRELELPVVPEFGEGVALRAEPCTPRELYCSLFVDLEEHVHYYLPAFVFATDALAQVVLPTRAGLAGRGYLEALIVQAREGLANADRRAPRRERPAAESGIQLKAENRARHTREDLALRVARELAPFGLADGAWLRGWVQSNTVETEAGMSVLKQLMLRFGDPGSGESYSQRYAALLRSLGVVPEASSRWEWDDEHQPSAQSYEHALLGLCLGLFPSTLGFETLGYNLWMVALGPCPLLHQVTPELRERGACLRYLERHDRADMQTLAWRAIEHALAEASDPDGALSRIARGLLAAQTSYVRWEQALLGEPVALAGRYERPQEPAGLEAFALARYGELSHTALYYCFANADRYPAIHVFGKTFTSLVFAQLQQAFASDARLNSQVPPRYSERTVAELVAAQYQKNVRSRSGWSPDPEPEIDADAATKPSITQVFDGAWLQGFADVARAGFEEYGWLFRIYASEHGDGDFSWNHCQIFRRAFAELGPDVMLPKTEPRLYELFEIGIAPLATLAVSLNTRHFMPEVLGLNLAIEATGVGGIYMDQWKWARRKGATWRALAWRLHNSIDNHADGHTKWSQAAIQSFMRRVKDGAPSQVEAQWQRIWRLWRLQDILTHGTPSEQAALAEHLDTRSLAPT